jgi:hypothetical protein
MRNIMSAKKIGRACGWKQYLWLTCAVAFFLGPGIALGQDKVQEKAQDKGQSDATSELAEPDGINSGDYNIRQSVEFGGRLTSFTGDQGAYDTFVNLRPGPRLFNMTFEMNSLDHNGLFFDHLSMSSSGYGGDPNDMTRLRMSKNKVYEFTALFRRDENFWDYSLLANPLNPTTPFPNGPAGFGGAICSACIIGNSPHTLNLVRRMGDYNLMLFPQSKLRFRIGYSRNVSEGPSLSSIHQGTEQMLAEEGSTVVNALRFGVDYRVLPRTSISYDQSISLLKDDSSFSDPFASFPVGSAAGPLADLGWSLNSAANFPCAATFVPGGFVNPTCSAYFNYQRQGRTRTVMPTEQFSVVSDYWKNVNLTARASYTGGDTNVADWLEQWNGREARTNARNELTDGPVSGQRVNATADLGAAWHATDKLSVVDSFHFSNFHNPVTFDSNICEFFSASLLTPANVFTPGPGNVPPLTCAAPADGVAGTPVHSTSSGPDISLASNLGFLKQDEKTNLFQVDYRFTRKFGARVGYRFRHRDIDQASSTSALEVFFPSNANRGDCALAAGVLPVGCAANGDGSFTFTSPAPVIDALDTIINEQSGLFGLWARPLENWRMSLDVELMSADNSYTRISPRQTQEYRYRTTYKPVPWATFSGSVRIWEGRNNVTNINNLQHDRMYGFSISLEPVRQFGIELGTDVNDVHSQILICYTATPSPAGLNTCPASTLLQTLSVYQNTSDFGYFDLRFTPTRRMTGRVGANITYTSGTALLLNPNAVPGPLNSRYYQPFAELDYRFARNWTGKALWGYYGYSEDQTAQPQDVFAPRAFRGNLETLSLRYAF